MDSVKPYFEGSTIKCPWFWDLDGTHFINIKKPHNVQEARTWLRGRMSEVLEAWLQHAHGFGKDLSEFSLADGLILTLEGYIVGTDASRKTATLRSSYEYRYSNNYFLPSSIWCERQLQIELSADFTQPMDGLVGALVDATGTWNQAEETLASCTQITVREPPSVLTGIVFGASSEGLYLWRDEPGTGDLIACWFPESDNVAGRDLLKGMAVRVRGRLLSESLFDFDRCTAGQKDGGRFMNEGDLASAQIVEVLDRGPRMTAVTVDALCHAFRENSVRAKELYQHRFLILSGVVEEVSAAEDDPPYHWGTFALNGPFAFIGPCSRAQCRVAQKRLERYASIFTETGDSSRSLTVRMKTGLEELPSRLTIYQVTMKTPPRALSRGLRDLRDLEVRCIFDQHQKTDILTLSKGARVQIEGFFKAIQSERFSETKTFILEACSLRSEGSAKAGQKSN